MNKQILKFKNLKNVLLESFGCTKIIIGRGFLTGIILLAYTQWFSPIFAEDLFFYDGKYMNTRVNYLSNNILRISEKTDNSVSTDKIASIFFDIIPIEENKKAVIYFNGGEIISVDSLEDIDDKEVFFKFKDKEKLYSSSRYKVKAVKFADKNPDTGVLEKAVDKDKLILNNKEVLLGNLLELDSKEVIFETEELGSMTIPIYTEEGNLKINSIIFKSQNVPEKDDAANMLIFSDCVTVLKGSIDEIGGNTIFFNSKSIGSISSLKSDIKELRFLKGDAQYLSDISSIKEAKIGTTGSVKWQYKNDRNCFGGAIKVGGKSYRKGLGLHARTELTYLVPQEYNVFECIAGIDEEINIGGAVLKIFLGQNEVYNSSFVVHQTDKISIKLNNANQLKIVVDYPASDKRGSWLNLAEARFLKGE